MNDKKINKNTILIVSVLLIGLCVIGGTYAWLSATVNVVGGTYSGYTDCFLVDYTDNTQTITGTMFPGSGPTKGLSGSVSMKINSSCNILGNGSIYLHINSGTSNRFGTTASAHCENSSTLETLPNYTSSGTCSSGGGSWVTNGKVFKYAVYDNVSGTGTPLSVGYFDSSKIGDEMLLYDGFQVNKTQKTFYIFFWLDGYVTDNTYTELPFDGYIVGRAVQSEDVVSELYQIADHVHFSGAQYVSTGVKASSYPGNYIIEIEEKHGSIGSNVYIFGGNSSNNTNGSRANIRIDSGGLTVQAWVNTSGGTSSLAMISSNTLVVNSKNQIKFTTKAANNFRELVVNGKVVSDSTTAFVSQGTTVWRIGSLGTSYYYTGDIYSVKIYGNGAIVREFIPCTRISDGAVGFYDTVTGGFFGNGGSGSLTTN